VSAPFGRYDIAGEVFAGVPPKTEVISSE